MNSLDHIVIAAGTLTQGVEYLQNKLGVEIPRGGCHHSMGTHNHLMRLGNEAYLELIAIDPAADPPEHPRWFALDEARMRESLRQQPRLITWVMNTPDIHEMATRNSLDIGRPAELTRDSLRWTIALPDDGRLLNGGLLPYCIQWHSSPHPSRNMADLGCVLKKVTLHHNRPTWLADQLTMLGARHLVETEALPDDVSPYLSASIETPDGVVTLP